MRCNHCEICRKSGKCTRFSHACEKFRKEAEKEILPIKGKVGIKK